MLDEFVNAIYGGFDVENSIEPTMWQELTKIMNDATAKGLSKGEFSIDHNRSFLDAVKHANEIFAAFKTHAMGKSMASKLLDDNGNLKPFDKWMKDISSISSHHVGSWLKTEYNTAVLRAHNAADWRSFIENKDIMPNLRWMPTTSPDAEAVHRGYWEKKLTLPVEHPFWNKHHPGDRWNCKCSLESTDDPASPDDILDDLPIEPAQRGLENNPGKDGKMFNDTHPYFPKSCNQCSFYKNRGFKNKMKTWFSNQEKDCGNCPFMRRCLDQAKNNYAKSHISDEENPAVRDYIQRLALDNIIKIKEKNFPHEHDSFHYKGDEFFGRDLLLLKRSFNDIFKHAKEDMHLMKWLGKFELSHSAIKKLDWHYEGWAKNRYYPPTHPKYNPNNPEKTKHPETKHFQYYSVNIDGKKFCANTKVHKGFPNAIVLYTIEKNIPTDLIREPPPKE